MSDIVASIRRLLPEPSRRCLVLVLEGIGHEELLDVAKAGVTPTLSGLITRGALLPVAAPYPPVAAVAWSTFMTACLPGKHGVFGFTHPRSDFGLRFADARDLRMPTLWERAAIDGLRSVVVNLPNTYPAMKTNGSLVSGFVAPDLDHAYHPPSLRSRIATAGYVVDVDASLAHRDPPAFSAQVIEVIQQRIRTMHALLDSERWSLGILAFTEADRLNRMWFHRIRDGDGIERDTYVRWFGEVDAFVSRCLAGAPSAEVIVVSAYGFGPLTRFVNLDAWLQEQGYLSFDPSGNISPSTKAFSMDPGRIYVASSQLFDRGAVQRADVMALVDDIAKGLSQLVDPQTGRPVIAVIRKRRDAYEGARTYQGPNLICLAAPGYELKSSRRLSLFSDAVFEGTHAAPGGIVLARNAIHSRQATVEDAGATALSMLGVHVDDIDGSSLIA